MLQLAQTGDMVLRNKDPRPLTYCYTSKRTVSQLTRIELETAVCDYIDALEQMANICGNMFETGLKELDDDFYKERFK
jgi:hypothetical protein